MKKIRLSESLIIATILVILSCKEKGEMKKAEYSGKDLSNVAFIERDRNTKQATFRIETNGKWKLYAGNTVENIDFSKPVVESQTKGVFPLNVSDSFRSYFQLITDEGKAILAERHLPMTGGYNSRDLGGYKNKDGRFVKWGKVFRSDDLHRLTDADLNYLSGIPLVSIVDFRSEQEIFAAPNRVPVSIKKSHAYSITPGNLTAASANDLSMLVGMDMDSLMKQINIFFVTDSTIIEQYRNYFSLLMNPENTPLMFHCSAGKDRTGIGAALFLYSVGVDEETIVKDYLLSNQFLGDKYGKYIEQYPDFKPLFTVKKEYLESAINRIKEEHGSIEIYLKNVLHVNLDKMKELYLY